MQKHVAMLHMSYLGLTVSEISGTMCTDPRVSVCRLLKKPKTTGTLSLYCETFHYTYYST